jgi:hypothetical protein
VRIINPGAATQAVTQVCSENWLIIDNTPASAPLDPGSYYVDSLSGKKVERHELPLPQIEELDYKSWITHLL